MQISLSSPELLTFFFSHNLKIQDGGGRHVGCRIFRLCKFGYSGVLIVWYLCSVPNLVQIYVIVTETDALMLLTFTWWRHLMKLPVSTFGHLRMAVMHLPIKFGADHLSLFSPELLTFFPKFKMAAAAILDFQAMWIWPLRQVDKCCIGALYQIWFKYLLLSLRSTHLSFRPSFNDVTRINFRFRHLVTWSSPHGCDASSHKIWCRYLYLIRSYWYFPEIEDGLVVRTHCKK